MKLLLPCQERGDFSSYGFSHLLTFENKLYTIITEKNEYRKVKIKNGKEHGKCVQVKKQHPLAEYFRNAE
jgi:hypothetical protein